MDNFDSYISALQTFPLYLIFINSINMGYYVVLLSDYSDEANNDISIRKLFTLVNQNLWIFDNEESAAAQLMHIVEELDKIGQMSINFTIYRITDISHYHSVDILGQAMIKENRVVRWTNIRTCLTNNHLPDQLIDPEIHRGETELFVFNINRRVTTDIHDLNLEALNSTKNKHKS